MDQSKIVSRTQIATRRGNQKSALDDFWVFALSDSGKWGWLPGISVLSALGLLLIAVANTKARLELIGAVPLFWLGILILYVPITVRLISAQATRQERLGLALLLGVGLYCIKVLHSPTAFSFGDEFAHWRTADDIIQLRHLFIRNPLLPVSAFYPGLEIVTALISNVSGLTIFQSGIVVLFIARILITLSLFLFFERASHSARIAGVASVLYTANPNYVFWGSQFSYESLALPMSSLVILIVAMLASVSDKTERRKLYLVSAIMIFAIIPTHHMTSYALISFLTLWILVVLVKRREWGIVNKVSPPFRWMVDKLTRFSRIFRNFVTQLFSSDRSGTRYNDVQYDEPPIGLMMLALGLAIIWLVSVASLTIGYLAPVLGGAVTEFMRLIAGESAPKQVFHSIPGRETPIWERFIAFGAIGLILLSLPIGWIRLWLRHRMNVISLVLATAVFAYPVTLAMRLTQKGTETSNRSSEFLFVAIALVIALGVVETWLSHRASWMRSLVAVVYITAIFIGGVVVGFAPWTRMPGPYQVGGDTRAIQPQSIEAAKWSLEHLGPGNQFISDGTNRILLGSYGRQSMVSGVSWVFFSPKMEKEERSALGKKEIQYLVVDRRLSTALPVNGSYFESGEPQAGHHADPIDLTLLEKFDLVPEASRVFDSGNITIYDVTRVREKP